MASWYRQARKFVNFQQVNYLGSLESEKSSLIRMLKDLNQEQQQAPEKCSGCGAPIRDRYVPVIIYCYWLLF